MNKIKLIIIAILIFKLSLCEIFGQVPITIARYDTIESKVFNE